MPCKTSIFYLKADKVTATLFKNPTSKMMARYLLRKNNLREKVIKFRNNNYHLTFSSLSTIIFSSTTQQNKYKTKLPKINTLIKHPTLHRGVWIKFPAIKNLLSINKSPSVTPITDMCLASQGLTHKLTNKRITTKNLKRA